MCVKFKFNYFSFALVQAKIRELEERIGEEKVHRKSLQNKTVWFGLGMMGLIGWSVVVPTLMGAALGVWLDDLYPGGRSWTLALLVAGLCLGCFSAWHWVEKEDKDIHQNEDGDDVE